MRVRNLLLKLFAVCIAAGPATAAGGISQTKNITVNSYVAYNSGGTATYNVQGDGTNPLISASNGAAMSAYINGVDNVTSILTANTWNHLPPGDWQLDMLQSTARRVNIDLTNAGLNGAVAPSDLHGPLPARLQENCTKVNLDITQMVAGQTYLCPAWLRFNPPTNAYYYGLSLNPSVDATMTNVSIYCVSIGRNGFCHYWTVDPPTGAPATAQLQKIVSTKSGFTTTDLGYFNLTFHFEIDETQGNP